MVYSPLNVAVNKLAGIALDGFMEITAKDTALITIKKRQASNPTGNFFIAVIHFLSFSFITDSPFSRRAPKSTLNVSFFKYNDFPD
jgi:hypothetical protein